MNASQYYQYAGHQACQDIVNHCVFPIIGYDPIGCNYVHKRCDHAPLHYSSEYNSWSEDYAVSFISVEDLQKELAQVGK